MTEKICTICGITIKDPYGHNAEPVAKGRCCGKCNTTVVIPERINKIFKPKDNG
tara:strand:+ start:360 stop:521 length:162 start_codon:yes stop_codon:yes gene_type:complete